MKDKIKGIILIAAILTSSIAWSGGNEVGNGGDAIKIGDKFYSFDLYENGVEAMPYFRTDVPLNPNVQAALESAVDPAIFPIGILARKISEIYNDDPIFAYFLIETMKAYSWRFINGPLKDIDDDQDTVVQPPVGLTQAAIRKSEIITVSRDVWDNMDEVNQAGLVLHEAFYSMLKPKPEAIPSGTDLKFIQESVVARKAVGFIFTRDFEPTKKGWEWIFSEESSLLNPSLLSAPSKIFSFYYDGSKSMLSAGYYNIWRIIVGPKNENIRVTPLMSIAYDDRAKRSICDRSEMSNEDTMIIKFRDLKVEIAEDFRYLDHSGYAHRGFYPNSYAAYTTISHPQQSVFRDVSIEVDTEEECIKILNWVNPQIPLAN